MAFWFSSLKCFAFRRSRRQKVRLGRGWVRAIVGQQVCRRKVEGRWVAMVVCTFIEAKKFLPSLHGQVSLWPDFHFENSFGGSSRGTVRLYWARLSSLSEDAVSGGTHMDWQRDTLTQLVRSAESTLVISGVTDVTGNSPSHPQVFFVFCAFVFLLFKRIPQDCLIFRPLQMNIYLGMGELRSQHEILGGG